MKFKLTAEANKLRKELKADKDLSEDSMDFQESFSSSDGFYYHVTPGSGVAVIEALVADKKQRDELRRAFRLVEQFEQLYYELALEC